jgi:hypothetical protein
LVTKNLNVGTTQVLWGSRFIWPVMPLMLQSSKGHRVLGELASRNSPSSGVLAPGSHGSSLPWLRIKLSPVDQGPWKQQLERLQDDLSTVIDSSVGEWDELKAIWNRMPTELRREQNRRRAIKTEVQKAREKLEGCREGSRKRQDRWQAARDAEQDEIVVDQEWFTTTPETRQKEAQEHQEKVDFQIATDKEKKYGVQTLLATCQRNLLPFEHAIAEAETRIKEDDTEMERIKSEQKGHISTPD